MSVYRRPIVYMTVVGYLFDDSILRVIAIELSYVGYHNVAEPELFLDCGWFRSACFAKEIEIGWAAVAL